ncbi:hypothetical protein PHLGIDRAFT_119379 [Phlebiopsis gigantea 11061_1 CR5-6]|uniref:Uncharacterized protein n=1 Tax=Phlebiopsis gigantea (strain 11061_1 CR5-6) TaxID=745531 RepID=A0A0C3RWK1_PHLG1|nr:hypothetical protein PHLGIDRAFT_119379 [Phlebiopsis gigantea 11061_1 CR5-6]
MAFKATHHRRHPQLHDHYARADSLLIGPGGEIVAAYGAGNRIPAIPEPVTGRLVQNTQAPDAQTQAISVVEASATLMASDTNKLSGITSATAAVSSGEASSPLATTSFDCDPIGLIGHHFSTRFDYVYTIVFKFGLDFCGDLNVSSNFNPLVRHAHHYL